MTAWGVAALSAGALALVVGTAARAVAARATLSADELRGAQRLSRGLYLAAGACLLVGLALLGLGGGRPR